MSSPQYFGLFNHKNFFRRIWSVTFGKKYFYILMLQEYRSLLSIFFKGQIMRLILHQQVSFKLYCDMYYHIYYLYHLIYQYTNFLMLK